MTYFSGEGQVSVPDVDPLTPADVTAEDRQLIDRLLPDLYRIRDMATLPHVMLDVVSQLIPNVFCTYNELNLRTGAVVALYRPPEWQPRLEALMPRLVPHVHQHPIYRYVNDTGDGSAHTICDFLTPQEWRATDFGRELASIGIADDLIFCLHTTDRMLIFIALNRTAHDFTERDRAVANLLRRHFAVAHDNAAAFTAAQGIATVLSDDMDGSPHGVAVVDDAGRLLHLNSRALQLIEQHFPNENAATTVLPRAIREWLGNLAESPLGTPRVMDWRDGDSHVEVRCSNAGEGRHLLLFRRVDKAPAASERAARAGLSRREAEVLHWAAEGKANAEIGQILSISPRTVGKHLEAVYEKLGVESRGSAMLWVHQGDRPPQQ